VLVHSEENNQEVLVQCDEEVRMNLVFSLFSQQSFFDFRGFVSYSARSTKSTEIGIKYFV
jgi:hypothetical protein